MDMPRTARITLENSFYHIIIRGNQRQTVFNETADYRVYMNILAKYKKRFSFQLFTFCLMPNHVHLLIRVKEPNTLSKIMRRINLSYTLYFNFKYNKVGHLWQDRFKSRIIEKESYLLECMRYIEENPVRGSLVQKISDYDWSSYKLRCEENAFLDNIF